jgi:hypothetical protein
VFGGYGFGPGYDPGLPPPEFAPDGLNAGQLAELQDNNWSRMFAERQQTLNWAAGPVRVPQVVVVQVPGGPAGAAPMAPVYRYRMRGPGLMDRIGAGIGHVLNAWLRLWRYANN